MQTPLKAAAIVLVAFGTAAFGCDLILPAAEEETPWAVQTTDPEAFAQAIEALDRSGWLSSGRQLAVTVRQEGSEVRNQEDFSRTFPGSTVLLPAYSDTMPKRPGVGYSPSVSGPDRTEERRAAQNAVIAFFEERGFEVVGRGHAFPVVDLRLPTDPERLRAMLHLLADHPHLDIAEPSQSRNVQPDL